MGAIVAPPLATWLALRHGWRSAFIFTGAVSLCWIPLWLWVSRKAPAAAGEHEGLSDLSSLLRDRRLWGFVAANVVSMPVYTLWTNWTTLYLEDVHGLTLVKANLLAPVPSFFAYAGGLAGGWLSLRWISRGWEALEARRRACLVSAVALLSTAAVPLMPGPMLSIAAVSFSFFSLDAFGGARAAFSVSLLTGAYGAMQAVISPLIGTMIDRYGYGPVLLTAAVTPMLAYGILHVTRQPR